MSRRIRSCASLVLFLVSAGALVFAAGDMTLTLEDGTNVYLHTDSTWSYGRGVHADPDGDVEISIGSGKHILVGADYTWRYSDGKAVTTRLYKTVHAQGTGEHKQYNAAVAQAEKTVRTRIISRVRAVVKVKGSDDRYWECIQGSGASVDKKESFGTLWSVGRTITLNNHALQSVEGCLKAPPQVEPPAPQAQEELPSTYTVE